MTDNDIVDGMAGMYSVRAEHVGAAAELFRDMDSASARLDRMSVDNDLNGVRRVGMNPSAASSVAPAAIAAMLS